MFLRILCFVFISLNGSFLSNFGINGINYIKDSNYVLPFLGKINKTFLSNLTNNGINYIKDSKYALAFLGTTSTIAWWLKHNESTNNFLLKIKEKDNKQADSVFNFIQQYRAPFYALLFVASIALLPKNRKSFVSLYNNPFIKLLLLAGLSISAKDYLSELTFWGLSVWPWRNNTAKKKYGVWEIINNRNSSIDRIKQTVEDLLFVLGRATLFLGVVFHIWKIHEFIELIKTHPKIAIPAYVFLLIEKNIYFAKNNICTDVLRKTAQGDKFDLSNLDPANKKYFKINDAQDKILINYDDLAENTQIEYAREDIATSDVKKELFDFFYNRINLHLINYCSKNSLDDALRNNELKKALDYFYLLMSEHCLCLGTNSFLGGHGHSMCCHGNFNLIYNNFPIDFNTNFTDFLDLKEGTVFYDNEKKIINYDNIQMKQQVDLYFEKKEEKSELINKDNNFFKILENINLYLEQNI